jgi:hypothetical protein
VHFSKILIRIHFQSTGLPSEFRAMAQAPLGEKTAITQASLNEQTVLLWTGWWPDHVGDWDLGEGTQPFANCPVNNCYLTGISTYSGSTLVRVPSHLLTALSTIATSQVSLLLLVHRPKYPDILYQS